MDKLTRLSRLRRLVEEAGGEIRGRKKLHKLAYLCQQAGTDLGQSFLFHMYGVYSPSLAQDIEVAELWNVLTETPSDSDGYVIGLGEEKLEEEAASSKDDTRGFSIVAKLAAQPPAVLEVMSTIVYLGDAGYYGDRLEAKLTELKGHLSSCFSRAYDLADKYFGIEAVTKS